MKVWRTAIVSLVSSVLVVLPAPGPATAGTDFTDVSSAHTFAAEIGWLAGTGVTTGYDNGDGTRRFDPSAPVLREQMAAFLHRYVGSPPVELPARSPFTDVAPSHVFYRQMVWLDRTGITTGYDNGDGTRRFDPSAPVLREQMAAFLHRLAGSPAIAVPGDPFTDVAAGHVFAAAMTWLGDRGITTGYLEPGGRVSFRPSAPVLREQMAAFLFRYDTGSPGLSHPQPVVTGTFAPGRTLRVEPGVWQPAPEWTSHVWLRDGLPIAGATGATYVVGPADVGHSIGVRMTGTARGSRPTVATSADRRVDGLTRVHAGALTGDETWTEPGVRTHVVVGDVVVPASFTLTLPAGTDVDVESGRAIEVHGRLLVAGTAALPVTTGTPGDGPGQWRGIRVRAGGAVDVSHLHLRSAVTGIDMDWPEVADAVSVRDSTFTDVAEHGVRITGAATAPVVQGNTVTGSGRAALVIRSTQLDPATISGNDGAGVGGPVLLGGTIARSGTLASGGLPYGVGHEGDTLTVAPGVTLTVPAGQRWESVARALDVAGHLVVAGTPTAPVVLGTSVPDAGDRAWEGVQVRDGGTVAMTHARVEHAVTGVKADRGAAIELTDTTVASASTGVRVFDGPPDDGPWSEQRLTRVTFTGITDTAIVLDNAHLVATDLVVDGAQKAVYAEYASAVLHGVLRTVTATPWLQATNRALTPLRVDATQLVDGAGAPVVVGEPRRACGAVDLAGGPAPEC